LSDEVAEGLRKVCDEELYLLYLLLIMATVIKSRSTTFRQRQTEMCLGFREKSKAKRTFARPRRRWEDIKMERKGTGCKGVV
jgi:hypothetical protein